MAWVGGRATGYTRIVLKWGDMPADLDTYVVPSQVETLDSIPVHWKAELPDGNGEVISLILVLFLYPLSPQSLLPLSLPQSSAAAWSWSHPNLSL